MSFHSNAHHHGSLPQQLGVVWDLLLKADPEGPSPIFHAALRHRFQFTLHASTCVSAAHYGQKIETAERMEGAASGSKRLSWDKGNKVDLPAATAHCNASVAPWQRLNFLPDPHGHRSLRPGAGALSTGRSSFSCGARRASQ